MAASSSSTTEAPSASVSPAATQSIAGFGASGAWWPTAAANFSPAVQQEIGDLLFGQNGLGLSQYRYNIGAGGTGVVNPYKAPQTFLVNPGAYNWNADQAGLTFLRLANKFHVPQLIGFANSAPAAWTTNHLSCGGSLDPANQHAYAQYLANVVAHLDSVEHIRLSFVSPVNEPDSPQASCHQEGMTVPLAQRASLIRQVAQALRAQAPWSREIADETSLVSSLLVEAPTWLSDPQVASSLAAIAHHTYDYPDAETLERVAQLPLQHWASEICCFDGHDFGGGFDPTITSGLWLGNTIWADLAVAHDSAFDWWVALSPNLGCSPVGNASCPSALHPTGRNDGLVYYDPNYATDQNQTLYLTKRYFALGNFSRYVRPGALAHQVTGLPVDVRGIAFQQTHDWTTVLINNSGQARHIEIQLPLSARTRVTATSTAVTDAAHNLTPAGAATVRGALIKVDLTPASITTVVARTAAAGALHALSRTSSFKTSAHSSTTTTTAPDQDQRSSTV